MTAHPLPSQHVLHLAEVAAVAVALQYGLARLLATAVEGGTRIGYPGPPPRAAGDVVPTRR